MRAVTPRFAPRFRVWGDDEDPRLWCTALAFGTHRLSSLAKTVLHRKSQGGRHGLPNIFLCAVEEVPFITRKNGELFATGDTFCVSVVVVKHEKSCPLQL